MATAHALPLTRSSSNLRNYVLVTAAYWADTLTDGAVRMLVLLYFNQRGYSAIEVAMLFLFYEVFGIVTNLVGGWMAARLGLKTTLFAGLGTQVVALSMLALVEPEWLAVPYVMAAQALSGIAKDLTKMSSKSAIKFVVADDAQSTLFKWVAVLTGSKNALKGVGFFVGGLLLYLEGFREALFILAYTDSDKVAMNVGFYYMANACGRLAGTVLSGLLYQYFGLIGCLWACVGLVLASAALARLLPSAGQARVSLAAISGDE